MTGTKSLFKELDEKQHTNVKLGNNREMQVKGKGIVEVNMRNDKGKQLHNVQYGPGLGYNLLSVGQLMVGGYSVFFDNNMCTITNKKFGQKV